MHRLDHWLSADGNWTADQRIYRSRPRRYSDLTSNITMTTTLSWKQTDIWRIYCTADLTEFHSSPRANDNEKFDKLYYIFYYGLWYEYTDIQPDRWVIIEAGMSISYIWLHDRIIIFTVSLYIYIYRFSDFCHFSVGGALRSALTSRHVTLCVTYLCLVGRYRQYFGDWFLGPTRQRYMKSRGSMYVYNNTRSIYRKLLS